MEFLIILGIIGIIFGIMFVISSTRDRKKDEVGIIFSILLFIAPETVRKMNMKTMSNIDDFISRHNRSIGICLLASGAVLLFVAYYLYKIQG